MTGGKRIIAFGPSGDTPPVAEQTAIELEASPEQWDEADPLLTEDAPAPLRSEWRAAALAAFAVSAWTGFYLWAERAVIAAGVTPRDGVTLMGGWIQPVLLIGLAWLLAMRTSRREAVRFGAAAQLLAVEAASLEQRLTVVNRELSLAREFIAAQSRDLDSLGRIAAERLTEHADRLQTLIRDNGAQVEAIAGVSGTALDNMERLRGQLPVIASATKDVTNTIGHASQSAQGALDALVGGLARVAGAGETSAAGIDALRDKVTESLALFDSRLDLIQGTVGARLGALEQRSEQLREQLTTDEADACAALERRAALLHDEFDRTRSQLDQHEAEALTSLRARLATLRDEAAALGRALREGEAGALNALLEAKARVEGEITGVVERLDKLDREALNAASRRIQELSKEALEFDKRLAERNRLFAEEVELRQVQARSRHDAEAQRLGDLFRQFDDDLTVRLTQQAAQQQDLAGHTDAIAHKLDSLSDRIAAIAAFGTQTKDELGDSLALLGERLSSSREALSGTGTMISELTEGSVRLLELLEASTRQTRDELPTALVQGEDALTRWQTRMGELEATVAAASEHGNALAERATATRSTLSTAMEELERLQQGIADRTGEHAGALQQLRTLLGEIATDNDALVAKATDQLTAAIEQLGNAARTATASLGDETAEAVSAIASRLGDESAAAVDRVMRERLAEAVGTLEQAASHAAGVSRGAALQLRDQLGKVNDLTINLEQRVARARERAEEQVDNDFARRVALITEALNSNAIDMAKALSTEITDTAWAAYLRGDRGVFTRRALRLIDTTEQREVVRMYEEDEEFRGNVSRYIHDFEGMLRQLLSTRDGHALGVTVLSSDMGKLYVLLAQSIERLRA